jgi:hypothetical protein
MNFCTGKCTHWRFGKIHGKSKLKWLPMKCEEPSNSAQQGTECGGTADTALPSLDVVGNPATLPAFWLCSHLIYKQSFCLAFFPSLTTASTFYYKCSE